MANAIYNLFTLLCCLANLFEDVSWSCHLDLACNSPFRQIGIFHCWWSGGRADGWGLGKAVAPQCSKGEGACDTIPGARIPSGRSVFRHIWFLVHLCLTNSLNCLGSASVMPLRWREVQLLSADLVRSLILGKKNNQ